MKERFKKSQLTCFIDGFFRDIYDKIKFQLKESKSQTYRNVCIIYKTDKTLNYILQMVSAGFQVNPAVGMICTVYLTQSKRF